MTCHLWCICLWWFLQTSVVAWILWCICLSWKNDVEQWLWEPSYQHLVRVTRTPTKWKHQTKRKRSLLPPNRRRTPRAKPRSEPPMNAQYTSQASLWPSNECLAHGSSLALTLQWMLSTRVRPRSGTPIADRHNHKATVGGKCVSVWSFCRQSPILRCSSDHRRLSKESDEFLIKYMHVHGIILERSHISVIVYY